jgi:hypothetical protein
MWTIRRSMSALTEEESESWRGSSLDTRWMVKLTEREEA